MPNRQLTLPAGRDWTPDLARTLESAADPVWLFDPDTFRMVWANRAGLDFWRAGTLEGLRARDFRKGLSAHAEAELEAHRVRLERGEVTTDRWTFFPDEGHRRTVDLLMAPTRLPDGRLGMLKRARAAEASPEAEATRGVEALKHTDVLVTMCTLEGRLLLENAAAERLYGFSATPPANAVAVRFAVADDAARASEELARSGAFHGELQVRTREGVRWHMVDIHRSEDPVTEAPCLIITERDISERKAHEQALEQNRAELEAIVATRTRELALERDQFEQVFDTVSALVLVVDPNGTIIRANAWAHSVLHTSALVGRPVYEACGFPSSAQLDAWTEAQRAPSEAVEVILQPTAERRLHVLWTPRISVGPDGKARFVLTGLDITELRDVETQLQITDRMATIGTLAAGVAHDLNNPLAYVTSNSEMLVEELGAMNRDDLRAMARDTLEGARRAATIVSQLRTFARGSASGAAGVAHVGSVLEFAARMAHNHVKHHAQVDVRCPSDLYATIDESKLGQVMLNLIVHAVESIDPGQASRHRVDIHAEPMDDGWLSLLVQDDGSGLSAGDLRRIFDPYTSPHTPPRGMSGLGLAISHRLITEAGGRVEVFSEAGHGTRVQVWLPMPDRQATADLGPFPVRPVSKPENAPLDVEPPPGPRILVVDDEPKLRAVMRRALRGYTIDEAEDGRQALEQLERRRYDLVLCDVMMPEMTGVELYETVLERWPERAERFVFLSGGAFTADTARFVDRTERRVLEKPFRMDQLRKVVERAIESTPAVT